MTMAEDEPISNLFLTAAANMMTDEEESSVLDILFNSTDGILTSVDDLFDTTGVFDENEDPFKDICSLSSSDSADELMMMVPSDHGVQLALTDHTYTQQPVTPPPTLVSDFTDVFDLWSSSVGESTQLRVDVEQMENGFHSEPSPSSGDSNCSEFCLGGASPSSSSASPGLVTTSTTSADSGCLFDFSGLDFSNVPEDFAINFENNDDMGDSSVEDDEFDLNETSKKTITVSRSADTLPYAVKNCGGFGVTDLQLTEEERMMLDAEGAIIPTSLPLTKSEERLLKKVRRKIRNKKSAQVSRHRKKEYINGLEGRVQNCTAQNMNLQKRVQDLEQQNMSLLDQLKKLQMLVKKSAKSTQAGTCVMVLVLSFVLLVFPSVNPFRTNSSNMPSHTTGHSYVPNGVMSRTLMNLEGADDDMAYSKKTTEQDTYTLQTPDRMDPPLSESEDYSLKGVEGVPEEGLTVENGTIIRGPDTTGENETEYIVTVRPPTTENHNLHKRNKVTDEI